MTTTPEHAKGGAVSGDMLVPSCDSAELAGATRHAESATACSINQLAEDIFQYFPEWNDQEISEKKVELSFAYMFGHAEIINKLESDIEMLTEKLRSKMEIEKTNC